MRSEPVVSVQPEVMRWARQSIGLSVSDVALRLKRSAEEIEAWEAGIAFPSYPQLEKLAYQIYKRPLAVFFLPVPPEEVSPVREFRTLPTQDLLTLAVDTHLHLRRAHAYQIALRELFGTNPCEDRIWQRISLSRTDPVTDQAASIRNHLGITLEDQLRWRDEDSSLKNWRKAIEDRGVFVFKESFEQKDISGFCLADVQFPVVYLNNSTTKTRQLFSLLHELAHLLLSVNGLSKFDKQYIEHLPAQERQIEQFCNAIAAEVLIPAKDFQQQTARFPADIERASEEQISELAMRYGVSREAILRRFMDQDRVSVAFYEQKSVAWAAQQKKGSGGDWYASKNTYLSERFAKEVVSRHYKNQLSVEQAADLLGIKPKTFAGLEQRILQGGVA
uniref:IrrE N-terminal-like domain-containing protein n=1 Tax=mine drainage metagenome TaxID=410659 RepID=E6QQ31_9ZZZZ